MSFIRITAAQAASLRKTYGTHYALDPIPLPGTSDYILTDAVLAHPAFASVVATLQALPVYAAWQAGVAYSVGSIVEHGGKLWRNVQAHTSQSDWQPPVVPALWVTAHEPGVIPAWVQPTGQQDSYALDALVTHAGRIWKSLTAANAFEPGQVGTWRDQSVPPMWVAPAGAVGLWQVNDVATHNGQTWRNTSPNNSFAPGVFGWVLA